jgi:hypothetical protein
MNTRIEGLTEIQRHRAEMSWTCWNGSFEMVWILNMWDLENSSRSNHTSETFLSTACLCGCTCGRFLGWCAFVVCVCPVILFLRWISDHL